MKTKFNHDLANQNRPRKKHMRWEIINTCINKINAKKYLEIGYHKGNNFNKINCVSKYAVDPQLCPTKTMFSMTSNHFFKQNKDTFDLIFIDGCHSRNFVLQDILNSLNCISDNGIICVHDLNPWNEYVQSSEAMLGDGWKAWVELRSTQKDLQMFVVNDDNGVGILKKGSQKTIELKIPLNYANLHKNRKEWLNLIDFKDLVNVNFS